MAKTLTVYENPSDVNVNDPEMVLTLYEFNLAIGATGPLGTTGPTGPTGTQGKNGATGETRSSGPT